MWRLTPEKAKRPVVINSVFFWPSKSWIPCQSPISREGGKRDLTICPSSRS